ncbi:MAG: hypothetical protein GAK45_02396 [Pseudomonas citronellolis]|nr:MAG: hypothetical protein GAK45_02396 [Pseudomonas citronellolis]
MDLNWSCLHHAQLDTATLYAILRLRCEVFVVEQKCPYQDVDDQDLSGDTCHLMAHEGGRLLAYLRLLDPQRHEGRVVIGRVLTAAEGRGRGLGHRLMEKALEESARRWPGTPILLSAQAHLQGYYGRYGFTPVSEVYLEDDIPHIDMLRNA